MLPQLVPRLWPFLSHTNRTVRHSCLQVLLSLLPSGKREGEPEPTGKKSGGNFEEGGRGERGKVEGGGSEGEGEAAMEEGQCPAWLGAVLQGALCHLFQRLALEGDKANTDLALQVYIYVCTCEHTPVSIASCGKLYTLPLS